MLVLATSALTACAGVADLYPETSSTENALCRSNDCVDGGGSAASGGSTDACQTDADCAAGLECEVEHGAGFCKEHGGGRDDDGSAGSGGSDDGSAGSGGSDDGSAGSGGSDESSGSGCTSDADCSPGLECEVEHGASYCKPHDGEGTEPGAGASCEQDGDCEASERCESIGHGQRACFADEY